MPFIDIVVGRLAAFTTLIFVRVETVTKAGTKTLEKLNALAKAMTVTFFLARYIEKPL
jgi:hypothetical protein